MLSVAWYLKKLMYIIHVRYVIFTDLKESAEDLFRTLSNICAGKHFLQK